MDHIKIRYFNEKRGQKMILGIDLGTSNSLAAVYKDGEVKLIKNSIGEYTMPSVVSIDDSGMFLTGAVARERLTSHPDKTASLFKRSIGTDKTFSLGDKELNAEELSAIVLKGIKEDAERFLGETIEDAIISVPAFFSNPQRKAVIRAGQLAGFNIKKIINEPTAAAMAYNMLSTAEDCEDNPNDENERIIMVLDLGGGTFDISIMEATKDVMEVVAVCGDNELGGRDFTRCLMELILRKCDIATELSTEDFERLWKCAERAKIAISESGEAYVKCRISDIEYECYITEAEYELECFDLLERIRRLMVQAVAESEYESQDIEDVIMVGGGTKLSIVKRMLEKVTDKELSYKINPDEAVVYGAALQGALYEKSENLRDVVMMDICPYYIGNSRTYCGTYEYYKGFTPFIRKNHIIPAKVSERLYVQPSYYIDKILYAEDKFGNGWDLVGRLEYVVPETEEDTTEVVTNYIIDTNGIIHHEVYIPCIDKTYSTTVLNRESGLDMEQAKARLEELRYLEIDEKMNDENGLLLARAESLYCEMAPNEQEAIGRLIADMEVALKANKKRNLENAKKALKAYMDSYEKEVWL